MSSPRVAVVTGSNKGIGYAIVKGLCNQFNGGIIYLTARNAELGLNAVNQIKRELENTACLELRFHQLDVCSEANVHAFAEHVKREHGGLDVLINNAGLDDTMIPSWDPKVAIQCIETNFFGALRVSDAFTPLLRANGKIINLGSLIGMLVTWPEGQPKRMLANPHVTRGDLIDLANDFKWHVSQGDHVQCGYPQFGYIVSKSLDIVLSVVQQNQFDKYRKDFTSTARSPGYVATDLNHNQGYLTPDQGAAGIIQMAVSEVESPDLRGKFVSHDGKVLDYTGSTPELDAFLAQMALQPEEEITHL